MGGVLDKAAREAALAAIREGRSRRLAIPPVEVLIEVELPSPTLVIVGGVHIAISLTSLAKTLGFRTIVVDPRKAFGSELRFPHADRLLHAWPDDALAEIGLNASTAVALLTHDPKLDDPALRVALPSPAFYVGALGSKKTQEKRRQRLIAAGLSEEQIARLRAPIGLDLGGRSPEEIALAVMAQVVAVRSGKA
jgi:xanthine dehydrogenase accessory factor